MPDAETQLRHYWQDLDERYPDLSVGEITSGRVVVHPAPRRRRMGIPVAVATAAAVILVVGGVAALSWLYSDRSPDTAAVPGRWEVVSDPTVFGEGEVWAVVSGGPGLVAAGSSSEEDWTTVVWTSVDGARWIRSARLEGNSYLGALAAGDSGLVLWTQLADGTAMVWTSANGEQWSPAEYDEALFGLQCVELPSEFATESAVWQCTPPDIVEVVSTHLGYFAIGPDPFRLGPDGTHLGGLVWSSSDGSTWTQASIPGLGTGSIGLTPWGSDLLAWGAGGAFAGPGHRNPSTVDFPGSCAFVECPALFTLFRSTDGVNWEQIDSEWPDADAQISEVVAHDGLLVALGSIWKSGEECGEEGGCRDQATWTSSDGVNWRGQPLPRL